MCCFFRAFFIFPFHKRREDPSIPADQAARTGLGSLVAVDTGTSAEARRARRERRKCIRNGTATESDFDAEIDAQGRELSAAVEERKQIDSKLEAAETRQAKYEKELEECKTALAAERSPAAIADLRNEKKRLEASIAVEGRKQSRLLKQSEPLDARVEELHANIAELKQQMGTWHE